MDLKDIGILPAKIKQFNKKNIFTVENLIEFFPRKYYDFTHETGLKPENEISCFVMRVKDVKGYERSQ